MVEKGEWKGKEVKEGKRRGRGKEGEAREFFTGYPGID